MCDKLSSLLLKKEVEVEEMKDTKPSSFPVSTNRQCTIWDNTTNVEIVATHKCTALNCRVLKDANWNMQFRTQLESLSSLWPDNAACCGQVFRRAACLVWPCIIEQVFTSYAITQSVRHRHWLHKCLHKLNQLCVFGLIAVWSMNSNRI